MLVGWFGTGGSTGSAGGFPCSGISIMLFDTLGFSRPRGYKTFFVLNSVEHEILNAHKYKNIKKFGFL